MKNVFTFFHSIQFIAFGLCIVLYANTLKSQWVYCNGPGNDLIVYCFASSGNKLFAGTYSGVYLSTNIGSSWTAVNNGLPAERVYGLVFSGPNLLAGIVLGGASGGVYRTTNNGTSWTPSNSGLTNLEVTTLAVFGNDVFAGTVFPSLNFRSTNNGLSWTQIGSTGAGVYDFVKIGSDLFAGTYGSGVYRSSNNGSSWTAVNNGLSNLDVYSFIASGSNLFVGLEYNGLGSLYRSTDSGMNWISVNNEISETRIGALISHGSNIIAGTSFDSDIFLSTNQGSNWTSIGTGYSQTSALTFYVYDNYIFAGSYGDGAWRRPLSEIISVQNLSTEVPSNFALHQNYPNPFNPTTNIEFAIPKHSNVKITVYDSQGKEVISLLNKRLNAGKYKVDFDGSGYSSGVYFYKLVMNGTNSSETEGYTAVKKMLLTK
ncbi:MAG: hypothetical protein HGGPFJEG_01181 [Ignavibacteria bacterium]|nr:hypothetical protein [Ignavibacteria bacterium]